MSFLGQVSQSFQSYWNAIQFVNSNKLWGWFILPGFINLLLFIASGAIVWSYSDNLTDYLVELFNIKDEDLFSFIFYLILIILRLIVALLFFFLYKYVILRADGSVRWESGENRAALAASDPDEPPVELSDAFRQ